MWERLEATAAVHVGARLRNVWHGKNVNLFSFALFFVVFCCASIQGLIGNAQAAGSPDGHGQRIAGVVKDALGRPVPGAHLMLQAGDGHIVARTQSGQEGAFEFRNVR